MYFELPEFIYSDSIVESCSLKYFVEFQGEQRTEIFPTEKTLKIYPSDLEKEATY